ncbi:hypothetical protein Taro_049201 [Colocasia esculenta]|uniref:DJ-1/PfpI domain-containing protein n=1 Tax=Colocasia esculenta TaxID=4460 RepID=A0A843XAE5_COLES|nr:hypothetical protein [Colocasia esculenta]
METELVVPLKFPGDSVHFLSHIVLVSVIRKIGGAAGSEQLHKSRVLRKLLKEQKLAGRVCGAICSSPIVLQKQGLLTNERVTAHPTVIGKLTGQVIDGADVVIDGKLITSKGLGTVMNFSLAIVNKLFGHARARSVAEGIDLDTIYLVYDWLKLNSLIQ